MVVLAAHAFESVRIRHMVDELEKQCSGEEESTTKEWWQFWK